MSRPVLRNLASRYVGRRVVRKRGELDRNRVLEQRSRRILEEALHQRRRRAGERVRGDRRLVLDDAPQHPVGAVHAQEVLELVERHVAPRAGALVHLRGKVEEAQEHALDVDPRVRLERGGEAASAEREADLPRAEEGVDRTANRPFQRAVVRTLDAYDDARQGEHAFEVDEGRRPAGLRRIEQGATEQARLPVPARRHEPRRVAASGEGDEPGGLTLAVDHVFCEELARDAERVRLGHGPQSARRTPICLHDVAILVCTSRRRHGDRGHGIAPSGTREIGASII